MIRRPIWRFARKWETITCVGANSPLGYFTVAVGTSSHRCIVGTGILLGF